MSIPQSVSAASAAEQRAREFLASGRFRKARDEIKPLVKLDRAKYLPLLVEANKGLAREMLAKGQVSEAQQVIAYLKTIASPAEVRALELDLAARSGQQSSVLPSAVSLLGEAAASLPESEKRRLADHLVLSFEPVPADGPAQQLAGEIRAVHEALEAIAHEQFERAQELLRPLPQSSVLSHWRVFIKGLVAFYTGEFEKAVRFFTSLPADSLIAKASRPFLLLTKTGHGAGAEATTFELAGQLAWLPGLGQILFRAEQQWQHREYAKSYKTLREAIRDFPSQKPDALGALTDFYFRAVFALPAKVIEPYEGYFLDLEYERRTKSPVERAMIARMLALSYERDGDVEAVNEYWENFLNARQQIHGANPRLASLVYERIGSLAALPDSTPCPWEEKPGLHDADLAVKVLQKSISLDPGNLDAHLLLGHVFEVENMSSERNRLLDKMTQLFPQNKTVLVQAGRGCLDRKAYTKGLEYLESAYELDRLDPAVPALMVKAKVHLARQAYEKKQIEKGRQIFAGAGKFAVENSTDLARANWTILAQEGLQEWYHGQRERGNAVLAQALQVSSTPVAFWFYAQMAYDNSAPKGAPGFPFAEQLAAAGKEKTVERAMLLLRIYHHWRQLPDLTFPKAEVFFRRYLEGAARNPFNLADARTLLEETKPNIDVNFKPELRLLAVKALKQDKKNPFFRVMRHLLGSSSTHRAFFIAQRNEEVELSSILEEANRRGDEKVVRLARQLLDEIERPKPFPLPPEEEDWEEDEEGGQAGILNTPLTELPGVKGLIGLLSKANDEQIRELRRTRPRDIPEEVFEMLLAVARGEAPPPAPERKFKPSQPDPNQMNLF